MTPDKFNQIVTIILAAFAETGLRPEPGNFRTPTGACALGVLGMQDEYSGRRDALTKLGLNEDDAVVLRGVAFGFNREVQDKLNTDHVKFGLAGREYSGDLARDFKIGAEIGSVVLAKAREQYAEMHKPVKFAPGASPSGVGRK